MDDEIAAKVIASALKDTIPVCPHCGEDLDDVPQLIYFRGSAYRYLNWDENDKRYYEGDYDDEEWGDYDPDHIECPHCGEHLDEKKDLRINYTL